MIDHQSSYVSSSSHIHTSQTSSPENSQNLKVTPEENAETIPSSAITTSLAVSYRLTQVNTLGHEPYKMHKGKNHMHIRLYKLSATLAFIYQKG